MPGFRVEAVGEVTQEFDAAPRVKVCGEHELVVGLIVGEFTDPIGPVVEVGRLLGYWDLGYGDLGVDRGSASREACQGAVARL